MKYLDHYRSDPRVVNFFSLASECLVHGEMLVLALGTPYSTPDDTEHYRPGFTDNVNMAMRILNESVDTGLLIRGEFKPSAQQRFFGIDGRFGREIKHPSNDGEIFSHSILYQYRGDKAKICAHFGWNLALTSIPSGYQPVITTREVDPAIEGSGWYLLIDGVIVDRSWKEVDLFDEHAEAIIDDPYRASLWRESAQVTNAIAIAREPGQRKMTWCEMGRHEMTASGSYCYSWRDIYCCKDCLDKHIATYFPPRKENS